MPSPTPTALGTRRELFIDESLIAQLSGGAQQRMHHPQPREIVIQHDESWEGTGTGYHSVFADDDGYRMYYKGFSIQLETGKNVNEEIDHRFTCYAKSADGIHWQKPALGLVEFQGSSANNIVLKSGPYGDFNLDAAHPAVFKDTNPNATPEGRYKAMIRISEPVKGLVVMQSADGVNWSLLHDQPVITDGAFDSQNLAFWDDERGEYRAYWRSFEMPKIEMPHSHPTAFAASGPPPRLISSIGTPRRTSVTPGRKIPRNSMSIRSSRITVRRIS